MKSAMRVVIELRSTVIDETPADGAPLYVDTHGSQLSADGPPNATLSIEQEERAWNSVLALDEDTLVAAANSPQRLNYAL